MQKILITGIRGFLAKSLLSALQSDSCRIVGLVREIKKSDVFEGIKIYDDVDELVFEEKEFDVIYHLASYIPLIRNEQDQRYLDDMILTLSLVKLFPKSRIIYASSVAVYGSCEQNPIKINSPFEAPDFYGRSKIASEFAVSNAENYSIVRFASLIGPYMSRETFVPHIIRSAKEDGTINILGDGKRTQDYVDVRDAADFLIQLAALKDNRTLLGASGKSYSNMEVAKIVASYLNCEIHFKGVDYSKSSNYDLEDNGSVFTMKYSLEESIKYMIENG